MTGGRPTDDEVIVNVFGRTDVGRTREHNEDAFIVVDLTTNNASLEPAVRKHRVGEKGSLFMVADGMGGAAAGEIASEMAVEIVLSALRASWVGNRAKDAAGPDGFARALKQSMRTANEQINGYATQHPEYRGMGTTATVAGILGDTLFVAQVGDSRAYLVRGGVARQITKDQSLMQKLIEAGEMTEEEAEHSDRRNIILQALGPEPTIKVDLTHQTVRRGDVLVLCSDGLSGQVSKDDIAAAVREDGELVDVCKRLIERANNAGGPDNITVIVARFDGNGLKAPTVEDEVGHRVFPMPDTGPIPVTADSVAAVQSFESPSVASVATAEPEAGGGIATPRHAMPMVTPERRRVGRVVMVTLLAFLLIGATWVAVRLTHQLSSHQTSPKPNAPTP